MKNNNKSILAKNTLIIKSMCITAILLCLSIITNYLTDLIKLTFLGSFLSLDLSLLFIIPIIFICGYRWSLFGAISLGLFSFIHIGISSWIGPVFNIVINIFVVSVIYIIYYIFLKKLRIKNNLKLIITFSISLIMITFFSCVINGFIFTPLYVALYTGDNKYSSFIELQKRENYNIYAPYVLGIKNYWTGIFSIYSAFNILKFSIVLFFSYNPINWIIKNKIADNYFHKIK